MEGLHCGWKQFKQDAGLRGLNSNYPLTEKRGDYLYVVLCCIPTGLGPYLRKEQSTGIRGYFMLS